ncbi:MAG: hypothetical protein IT371_28955 [Deltaproteobacteria bacterium]|nr:hypothetical protein [Deltaproteobacteria bacterium]
MRFVGLSLALLVLPGWLGCSGTQLPDEDATSGTERSFGLLSVAYGHDWGDSGDDLVLTTTAQFVRYGAFDREQVSRLLALPLEPGRDLPGLDACRVYDLTVDLKADGMVRSEEPGNVELLEAGDLRVQTQAGTVLLVPRHYPGLLPFISGVAYGEAQAMRVPEAGGVKASAGGGEAVGAFTVHAPSPTLPKLTRVGSVAPTATTLVSRTAELPLRWQAAEAASQSDVTYIELRFSRGRKDQALRCRVRDDGAFDVPAALMSSLAPDGDGKLTLELSRLRRTFFVAPGLEQGELRVAVRDRAPLQLQ